MIFSLIECVHFRQCTLPPVEGALFKVSDPRGHKHPSSLDFKLDASATIGTSILASKDGDAEFSDESEGVKSTLDLLSASSCYHFVRNSFYLYCYDFTFYVMSCGRFFFSMLLF